MKFSSSAIAAATYNQSKKQLTIRFTSGRKYRYRDVPVRVYADLLLAESKGKFYSRYIRAAYRAEGVADVAN